MVIKGQAKLIPQKMKTTNQNKLIIHHISDLHFEKGLEHLISGYDLIPENANLFRNRTHEYLTYLEQLNGDGPDVVIVSGDLTYYATEKEFQAAEQFLKAVNAKVDGRIVVVPGNHDVDWNSITPGEPLSATRLERFKSITTDYVTPFSPQPYLKYKSLLIYALDSVGLSGVYFKDDKFKRVQDLITEKLADPSSSSADDIERLKDLLRSFRVDPSIIGWEQLDALQANVRSIERSLGGRKATLVKIAVLHHHMTGFGEAEVREYDTPINAGYIKHKLADSGFQIVLHGHKHTFNAILEKDLSSGLDIFLLGAGTLSSYGHTKGFSEMHVDMNTGIARVEPFHWDNYSFKSTGKRISLNLKTRLAIEGVSDSSLRFFAKLNEIVMGMETRGGISKDDFHDVLRFLEARVYGVAGVDEEFLDEMNNQLKDRAYNRLFFTDILGPHSWSHPDFSVHMAQQIRHYIEMNFKKVLKDGEEKWEWRTKFTPELNEAIVKCFQNARDRLENAEITQFDWLEDPDPSDDPPEAPRFEIARVLLWKEQDLLTTPAKVLIKLHKYMNIPLFYINPKKLKADLDSSMLGEVLKYEYHIFVRSDNSYRGKYYYSTAAPFTRGRKPIIDGVPGRIGNPVTHFYRLLSHTNLYLAYDYQKYLEERRRQRRTR